MFPIGSSVVYQHQICLSFVTISKDSVALNRVIIVGEMFFQIHICNCTSAIKYLKIYFFRQSIDKIYTNSRHYSVISIETTLIEGNEDERMVYGII